MTAHFQQPRLTRNHGYDFLENRNSSLSQIRLSRIERHGILQGNDHLIGRRFNENLFSKPTPSTKRCISSRKNFHSSGIRLFWFGVSGFVGSCAVSELATGDCCSVISFLSMTYQATKKPRSNMVKPLRVIIHQFASSFDEKALPVTALVGSGSIADVDLS